MKNKIITSEGNVQFQFLDGKIVNVHPNHLYTVFNEDTVSFILIALPPSSGLAIMASKAEDLELDGQTYSIADLPNAVAEAFAEAEHKLDVKSLMNFQPLAKPTPYILFHKKRVKTMMNIYI